MKLLKLISFLMTLHLSFGTESEEAEIYKASGVELIDLIRGLPTKEGAVTLTKVDKAEGFNRDGIYLELPKQFDDGGVSKTDSSLYLINDADKYTDNKKP